MSSKKKGFTLIELLVVISIIGLLASVIMVSLNSARAKARDARRMEDIHQIQNAIELYIVDHGVAPDTFSIDFADNLSSFLIPNYIRQLPKDPLGCSNSSCDANNSGPNGAWFTYAYKGPSTLISEGLDNYTPIHNTSYMVYAENLESKGASFGYGDFFPGSF